MRASWMPAKEGGQSMLKTLCLGALLEDLAELLGVA
jgi:hypothetical protein